MKKRMEKIFKRDMLLLLHDRISLSGALSTLCIARKFSSPTAWKLFYVRYMKDNKFLARSHWKDDENYHNKHNTFISSISP